ncbi:hypothetical protein M885DRAFT_504615 [Pelagophyceae sp. CCMP2097]|nr:hypothetical protein M885DRAFT_504615 [Pelagophyceae sp. CCMP2097]|mmetsp:Transcript_25298/g.86769  ORF Transcript_25298/g.86769 Transcript_25298/m.86769 type:complete len:370 (-) Transcript_25298:101-1210(-)
MRRSAALAALFLLAPAAPRAVPLAAPYRALPPGSLIVAYATSCNATELHREVAAGVNVLVWFSIALQSVDGQPTITGGPDKACVLDVKHRLDAAGYTDVAHLISVGGWDAPHPNYTVADGGEWWNVFSEWNGASPLYDGIDWDLEGNDNPDSPYNEFAIETLFVMREMSASAKRAGAAVSLVPPQSYLDTTESGFDRSLRHAYADWQPNFHYRGRNAYAALLAWDSFLYDFVDVQLYESWSRAGQAVEQGADPAAYLAQWVSQVTEGWLVDFASDESVGLANATLVRVPASKLVVGFSFGSKPPNAGKSCLFEAADVQRAFDLLGSAKPRGLAFWNTHLDYHGACDGNDGINKHCDFATGFNDVLKVRP